MNQTKFTVAILVFALSLIVFPICLHAQVFNGNLSATELETIQSGEVLIRNTGSLNRMCVNSVNPVVEKALATAKARKALSICGEKNDWGDAKVISIFAPQLKLQEVSVKTVNLKRIITKRKLLVTQRTQIINNLKSSFNQSGIKLPFKSLSTIKAYKWLQNNEDICIQQFGKMLQTLNETIKTIIL